jgi:ribonucleoside-diphosphate reductase alpha chain
MSADEQDYGPKNEFCRELHQTKYRIEGETFDGFCNRVADTLADTPEHKSILLKALRDQAWLPAGREQLAVGNPSQVTAFNCFVSDDIPDSYEGIMRVATECGATMRMGGGVGMNFGTIRPNGTVIKSSGSIASGPVSFMKIWDAVCATIQSQGLRRGAMMGVMPVDHPDILEFVRAKRNNGELTNFNVSVAITDAFMDAVKNDEMFQLQFDGKPYHYDKNGDAQWYPKVRAQELWDEIMTNTWDWAEPGVLFMDHVNKMNPLNYCETITATNPCGEQPLPAHGACLLGSMNCTAYLSAVSIYEEVKPGFNNHSFDWDRFEQDIRAVVRATDNIIDSSNYPLKEQEREAKQKRRMGIGLTGLANTIELLGHKYASEDYINFQNKIFETLRDTAYETSVELSKEKGAFPLFDAEFWLDSGYAKTLPDHIREGIREHGLRNGLLLSIAPTGTISLCADNVSAGIEPTFSHEIMRDVMLQGGKRSVRLQDWALAKHGFHCTKADEVSVTDHVKVLCAAQHYIDSAVSKTCNVGDTVTYEEFKQVYMQAYDGGAKGCTTFRMSGKRAGIMRDMQKAKEQLEQEIAEGAACYIDLETGQKSCS